MRYFFLACALMAGCATVSDRVETLSQAPSYRAKTLAIAGVRGGRGQEDALSRELVRRLLAGGMAASSLGEADSVVAGAALGLEVAVNPRVLAEIRRATGADGVVFLAFDPGWRSLDVSVLDATTGDPVFRASGRPRGEAFASTDEAAATAAEALFSLAPDRARAAAAAVRAGEPQDEIPVP